MCERGDDRMAGKSERREVGFFCENPPSDFCRFRSSRNRCHQPISLAYDGWISSHDDTDDKIEAYLFSPYEIMTTLDDLLVKILHFNDRNLRCLDI